MTPARLKVPAAHVPLFAHPGHQGGLRALRNAAWHAGTYERQQLLLNRYRSLRTGSGVTDPFPPGFRLLPDPWKAGGDLSDLRTPQAARVDVFDALFPGTRTIFHSVLWTALDSRLSLGEGARTFDRLALVHSADIARFQSGLHHEIHDFIADGTSLAIAVLRLRIFRSQKNDCAFHAGLDVLETLCYMALTRKFRPVLENLAELVAGLVLRGLRDETYGFLNEVGRAIRGVISALIERAAAIDRFAGISQTDAQEVSWSTRVELSRVLIDAITHSYKPENIQRLDFLWRCGSFKASTPDVEKQAMFRIVS